jgi:Type III restriction enzyme, res subunit.
MNVETDERDILSFFPYSPSRPAPRSSQKAVCKEIDKVFREGKRIVILEAPVGSGKSAIAMTFARKFKDSHIITPRKSLQDQYFEDFPDDVVLMKGRNAYPCTTHAPRKIYLKVIQDINNGKIRAPSRDEDNCANAPCRNSEAIYKACTGRQGPCPYNVAIEVAQKHHTVIHNIHSFVFQTNFGEKFEKRSLMIIDEAHEIEDVLRGFISKKFTLPHVVSRERIPHCETIDDWCDFFGQPEFLPEVTAAERARKEADETYVTNLERYLTQIDVLKSCSEYYGREFTVRSQPHLAGSRQIGVVFEFIPHNIGNAANKYLFSYGDKVLLMSGTIYDKEQYCRYIGINPSEAYFIRVPSTFPVKNRPIYAKADYQVDTSHRNWNDNFKEMIEKITKIMNIFKDVKGLIHVPSYEAAEEIASWLSPERVVTHSRHDFQEKLEAFYASKDPLVFISPVCQQGVDFKGDRARFQIITRIPYLNTADPFVEYKVQNDFPWYNYKALVTFGQQIGRVNRAENDYGATFLMDERFNRFIARNSSKLPKWLRDAIVYK